MYDVAVEMEIAAAHQLAGYNGKCENVHGHNWVVRAEVSSDTLNECGLALDFNDLKRALKSILERYDHAMLNELPEFKNQNPTSENMAAEIYRQCQEAVSGFKVSMKSVTVWESPRSFVRYYE
jgi:6-pyruvoyltetrahydropterin/6-carboxytetrahydropterin synthase